MNNFIYKKRNDEFINILYLHGWRQMKESLYCIDEELKTFSNSIFIDLPPYLKENFYLDGMDNYLDFLLNILMKNNITKIDLIVAHSFGGKLALEYCLKVQSCPLVLCAPSIVKDNSFIMFMKRILYKMINVLHLQKYINIKGSKDYQVCKNNFLYKKNFLSVVNTYYEKDLKNVESNVLLLRGEDDNQITLNQCKKVKKKLKKCVFIQTKGNHFSYKRSLEEIKTFVLKEINK